uniref:Mannose-1-phosphate guanyltransferase C-terminal domain-containing protein n=1 Tax=Haptolina brevifila TaxID=156173 RepID=A0A7S2CBR3_9EUKA|mmetsp:Transcript_22597/g.45360  ORF Transcript_22597/g.45360 Transcript_22597/m.45360 type:complete len:196 (+) Transcript_22597:53-640(+)
MINAGVYVFSPSIFKRIDAGRKVFVQEILPKLANSDQLQSCLLSGHWVKMTDVSSYLGAVGPHLEMMRFMKPEGLAGPPDDGSYEVRGDVMVHPSASVGAGCVLGPRVVIGANCKVGDGVRLESTTLLEGAEVQAHALVKDSLIGWRCVVGQWSYVTASVFGEEVHVAESLLVRGATVLPHKELFDSIRQSQIVI